MPQHRTATTTTLHEGNDNDNQRLRGHAFRGKIALDTRAVMGVAAMVPVDSGRAIRIAALMGT